MEDITSFVEVSAPTCGLAKLKNGFGKFSRKRNT